MDTNQQLRAMPIDPAPCKGCVHLREAKSAVFGESNVVCGWWDDVARFPALGPWLGHASSITDAQRCLTRKRAFGPHTDAEPWKCGQFSPKPKMEA